MEPQGETPPFHHLPSLLSSPFSTAVSSYPYPSLSNQQQQTHDNPSLQGYSFAPGIDLASILSPSPDGLFGQQLEARSLETDGMRGGEGSSGGSGSKGKAATRARKVSLPRFEFQTRSANDILDDGFRWRKYGQKAVKNSTHPRDGQSYAGAGN